MIEPLHHFMRAGIVQFVAFPCINGDGPILESVQRICADPYFEVIEISWVKDPHIRRQVQQVLKNSGMKAAYCAHPWLLLQKLDLNTEGAEQRDQAVKAIFQAIDDAVYFEIKDVALLSGAYPGIAGKRQAMDRLQNSLEQICEYAHARGIQILLEVFDQEFDKKRLIGKSEDAAEIAERVGRTWDNFGIMVDLSHLPLLQESPREALEPVKTFLKHVHIGNCYMGDRNDPAWGDMHPRFGYPGSMNDVAEITEFLKVLFEIGYLKHDAAERPIVSFEIKPVGTEDPEFVIADAKNKLNAAWTNLQI